MNRYCVICDRYTPINTRMVWNYAEGGYMCPCCTSTCSKSDLESDDEQAELRKQQDALAAQKAEQEAELARQQAAISAERERLERAEAERVNAENLRQAELARKEQERLDAEQAERDEAERVAREEALRPDLEKLKAYANEFLKGLPIMSTEDGFAMRDCLRIAVESIIEKWDV